MLIIKSVVRGALWVADRRPTVLSVIIVLRKDVRLEPLMMTLVVLIVPVLVALVLVLRYYRYITLIYQ